MEICRLKGIGDGDLSFSGRGANLRLGLYKCPSCGVEIEIFSDEHQVECYQCAETIYRERVSPCIEWCASANECLGKERW